jgi:hypothetical protein
MALMGKDPMQILLVLTTIIGAFGGFPTPPRFFTNMAKYAPVQWALVFVLAYQGGAGQDPVFAAASTAAVFVLYKLVTLGDNVVSNSNIDIDLDA